MSDASRAAVNRPVALALIVGLFLQAGAASAAPSFYQPGAATPGGTASRLQPPAPGPRSPAPLPKQPPPRQALMPSVTGLPLIIAQVILLQHGLVAQTQTVASDRAQGIVTDQAPAAGEPIAAGRAVRLSVSSGPRPAPPPPRPTPQPAPRPIPTPVRPPVHPGPIVPPPQPVRPLPIQPQPAPPSRVPPSAARTSPSALSAAAPPPSASPVAPMTPVAPAAPAPAPPGVLDWAEANRGWLALAALIAALAAGAAAWALRGRPRAAGSAGAQVPFSVAAMLVGGVRAAASDVHPTAAPTVSLAWTIHIPPPRIEGLRDGQPEPDA